MALNSLYLFKNVKITPDYSVVHDFTPTEWRNFLLGQNEDAHSAADIVWSNHLKLNYYRIPDTIRIEGNYDEIRTATYGMLEDGMWNDEQPAKTSFKYVFFWIRNVRLVTQRVNDHTEGAQTVFDDVVELEIDVDTWSTYGLSSFQLYDSFVERRHMKRWNAVTQAGVTTYTPIYYPNAAQGIEGAYQLENSQDLTEPFIHPSSGEKYDPRYIIVFVLKPSGESKIFIGLDLLDRYSGPVPVYHTYNTKKYFGIQNLLDGSFYTEFSVTAEMVQSITVLPVITALTGALTVKTSGGMPYFAFDEMNISFAQIFDIQDGSGSLSAVVLKDFGMTPLRLLMRVYTPAPNVTAPDHDAAPVDDEYLDDHEPMMYMSPARIRKAVTAFGGEVFTVPDIAAFESTFTLQNVIDMNSAITYVFAGNDLQEANIIGALGVVEAATLPIHNSAWRSYEAINKVGDEIAFNAKQMQTIGGGIANTGLSAAGGFMMGGPVGALLGVVGGVTNTALAAYGNEEELRAKQVTIKNSPCVVKSGGSGLGAYVRGLTDVFYITLKMDDQSMEKLRFMYYWYGYHVNRMFKGSIDLHTRSKFDFIKTNGAKVRGALTAGAASQIAAIFDNGVTIYHGMTGYDMIGSGQMYENDEVE